MHKMLRMFIALALATGLGMAPVLGSEGASPVGIWQTPDRYMDYAFEFCGSGEDICVKLVGLRKDADNTRNRQFLNTYLLRGGKPAGPNRWKGTVNLLGHSAYGTLRLTPGKSFEISGCTYVVLCATYTLIPAE